MIFSSSDGSFLAIGCLNKFSNDMFRDYIRSVFCSIGLLLITSLVFGMATVVGIGSFNLRVKRRDLSVLELRSLVFNDMDVYEYLYEFFNQSMLCQVCLCLFAMVFFFWQISSMMLMAEGSLGTFYRMVKSSSRLPMYTIRFIILLFHCILVLWLHIELQPHRHLPFLLTPYVAFIQSAAFNFIGFRRLFTIMLTMCSTHRLAFYKKRMQLAVYYQIFLPFFTALPVLFEMITNGFSTAKYALGIPILFGFIVLFRYRLQKQTLLALAPTRRFRPTFNRDYDEFFKQQRAIGGVVQDKSLGFRGLFKIWWMKYGKGVKEEEMGDI